MTKEDLRKKYRNKLFMCFLLFLISVTALVSFSYAWFTDVAAINNNTIYAGNLYLDIVANKDDLEKAGYYVDDVNKKVYLDEEHTIEVEIPSVYERYYGEDDSENYYILTGAYVPLVRLCNFEPGQGYPVSFGVLNSGDLAAKYSVFFEMALENPDDPNSNPISYTGLETLEKQKSGEIEIVHPQYEVNDDGTIHSGTSDDPRNKETYSQGDLSDDVYEHRKAKLEKMQLDENGNNIGGHLEDVLQVYYVDKDSIVNGKVTRAVLKESNYIGTVRQIIDSFDTNNADQIYVDIRNKMFDTSCGYIIPKETVTDEFGFVDPNGVTVNIYDYFHELMDTKENVSELSKYDFVLYMPEDADNLYQNAYIEIDIGAAATQFPLEVDGLDYMIYDNSLLFE